MAQISDSFYNNVMNAPEKMAIWCEGTGLTYGQLANLVTRWTSKLSSQDVRRGDHIGVLLPNSIEFVSVMLAAANLGVVIVPLNTSLPASAILRAFQASDVKHVIAKSDTLRFLRSSGSLDFSFVDGLWLSIDSEFKDIVSAENLFTKTTTELLPLLGAQDDDPFILTMTSGSTGDPKPIILTQRTKFNRATSAVKLYSITKADRVLAATPLYHSLAERLVLIPLLTGGTSILMARYSPSEWLRCVSEQEVSFTIAVSSQLRQIAEQLTNNQLCVSSLRCVVSSSSKLETQIKSALLSKLQCQFHECYGTSEIAIASNLDVKTTQAKLESVGKAVPGVEIKILRRDGGIAPTGEIGEIVCRTPMIFGGYFKRMDLTKKSMWGDYFRTGDIGKVDEEGFLYYMGRTKDIIITGGINVYPNDIESVLSEHPLILENAAFSLPDEKLGEIVAVVIVPKHPQDFNLKEIRLYCAKRLADFQQPRKFFIAKYLPKNEMGKIMKHSLTASYLSNF